MPLPAPGHAVYFANPAFVPMLIKHKEIKSPYLTDLWVENRSRRDIRSSDFDQGKPLRFELGAKIRYVSVARNSTIDYQSAWVDTETAITLAPVLIRGGQRMRVTIVTDGAAHVTCPHPPLAGVTVREPGGPEQNWRAHAGALSFTLCWLLIFLGLLTLLHYPTRQFLGLEILVIALGIPATYLSRILAARRRASRSKRQRHS